MVPSPQTSPLIAGSVLPIRRAEELLSTLPGVIAARIIAGDTGAVDEIHVLTTTDIMPKQTVRNIESALIAHLGMRVDHRKISVATSLDPKRSRDGKPEEGAAALPAAEPQASRVATLMAPSTPAAATAAAAAAAPAAAPATSAATLPVAPQGASPAPLGARAPQSTPAAGTGVRRAFFFDDVEVRRSRTTGITCRVTLSKGDQSFVGEAEGMENERSRIELAARATLRAIAEGESGIRPFDLSGAKLIEAFDREFVFVGVTVQQARESVLLTGSCELKDSAETASVLAVLDATNRWLSRPH